MDFFKSGLKSVLGAQEAGTTLSAPETVNTPKIIQIFLIAINFCLS